MTSHSGVTVSSGTEEIPSQRLKVATLPLDLPCSGPVTHSGDISITGKSHKKKPDKMKETQQIIIMDNVISLTMYTGPYSSYTGSIKRDLEYSRATSVHGL
jgi:hypothetical protein